MTQKQIKAIKKDIVENGVIQFGYWNTIKNEFSFDEIIDAVLSLIGQDVDLFSLPEWARDNFILTECINNQSYQDFKNNTLRHIIGQGGK